MTMFVHASARLARVRREAERRSEKESPRIWARVVPPNAKPGAIVYRTDWLTPYTAQTIAEDALRAERGTGLDVTVAASATDADLARVQRLFAWLGSRGVQVNVRRDGQPPGAARPPGPNRGVGSSSIADEPDPLPWSHGKGVAAAPRSTPR